MGVAAPQPPDLDVPEEAKLDAPWALRIADMLRDAAAALPMQGEDNDGLEFNRERYQELVDAVFAMQSLHDQLDPMFFVKAVKAMEGRVAIDNLTAEGFRKSKYNVFWLLRVLMMCDILRSADGLLEALKRAMEMCLPPILLPTILDIIGAPSHIVPSASSISRWRLLLDAALMMAQRSRNNNGGEYCRYLMSDSSTQHGRSFQMTVVTSIKKADLVWLYHQTCDLANMRSS